MISTFFRVAFTTAVKSLPEAQSTQATRSLSTNLAYNFVKPHRGDVFVFRTNHIPGIREDPEAGAPFYIKRLAGLPGDTLRIDPPFLYVNGKKAEGYGFERVMSARPPYRGYAFGHDYLSKPDQSYTVPRNGYFALGDNSYNSYDSRYWGAGSGRKCRRARFVRLLAVLSALGPDSLEQSDWSAGVVRPGDLAILQYSTTPMLASSILAEMWRSVPRLYGLYGSLGLCGGYALVMFFNPVRRALADGFRCIGRYKRIWITFALLGFGYFVFQFVTFTPIRNWSDLGSRPRSPHYLNGIGHDLQRFGRETPLPALEGVAGIFDNATTTYRSQS